MRRLVLVVAILAFGFASKPANAQSSIGLGLRSSGSITFTSEGGGVVKMTVASETGPTTAGTGSLAGGTTYTLVSGSVILTPTGGGFYTASGTLNFELNGGSLLTGTLSLGSVVQLVNNVFTVGTGNLTITGGSVCTPTCPGPGNVTLTIMVPSILPLHSETGKVTAGNVTIPSTPEPNSMLLFGTGFLALGAILRRRLA